MILYIAVFLIGFLIGAGSFIAHKRSVQRAVEEERTASQAVINKLKRDADQFFMERNSLLRERDMSEAYNRGRESPLSDAEKLARTLEGRHAKLVVTSREST